MRISMKKIYKINPNNMISFPPFIYKQLGWRPSETELDISYDTSKRQVIISEVKDEKAE